MLFQGLLPAVALVTEGTGKLFCLGPLARTTTTPVEILEAHLFFEVLLETRLVGKFPAAVGTCQGSFLAVVGRLDRK